jgi:hypothetical protein
MKSPMMDAPFGFRDRATAQQRPYSIFVAKTPIDDLVAALPGIWRIESHQANLPLQGKLSDLAGVPIVKFKDSPWVVVYWSMGRSAILQTDCTTLSDKINTTVVYIKEDKVERGVEWFVMEEGEEVESAAFCYGEELLYFESSLREDLDFEEFEDAAEQRVALDQAFDELLTEQQIWLPGMDLELSAPEIERVDLLILPEQPLGTQDFFNWINQGHCEYSIFAVKAPLTTVAEALEEQAWIKDWEPNVESDESIYEALPQGWLPIVQPTSNPWTVVYWAVGYWENVSPIAQKLSSILATRVTTWAEEDTSGAFGYEIYENGKELEHVECCPEMQFSSSIREEPEFDNFDEAEWQVMRRFIHETFIQEGVYIPSWDLAISDPVLERVDFVLRP